MLLMMSATVRAGIAVGADVTAPTAPTITATADSASQITIALTVASTDASGIASYSLERSPNGSTSWSELDATASFPYSDTGLTAETEYFYRARATDNASNVGDYSSVVSDTTEASSGTFRGASLPTAPETFTTPYSAPTGNTWTATNTSNNNAAGTGSGNRTGCGAQYALDNCALNDLVELTAGATYTGPFTLPNKTTGSGYIYIQSSAYASLPAAGVRVAPADASNMAKIVIAGATGLAAITNANTAHHIRLVGIEVTASSGFVFTLVETGSGVSSAANLPHHITFDRCYIHAPSGGGRRGFQFDGAYMALVNSYVSGFKEDGADSQALAAWNGTGPWLIDNNYLEGAGENVMFGGAETQITDNTPSDIVISNNHFFKPREWISETIVVKNILEFKHAQRIRVWHNTFENNWEDSQSGMSFLITPRNENGGNPWACVRDVDFQYNEFIGTDQGINISGDDNNESSLRTQRVLIRNNLIRATDEVGTQSRGFQITRGPEDVIIDHNTIFCVDNFFFSENSPDAVRFVFTNNITERGGGAQPGFSGTATSEGNDTLTTYYTSPVFTNNVIWGGSGTTYPAGNFFAANEAAVGFENAAGGDYTLDAASTYKGDGLDGDGNPDGTDLGITNFALLGPQ